MYQYVFTCCGLASVYEKKTLDEDFKGWSCPKCEKPVTKDKLYKIGKKEGDGLKLVYHYREDGPYRGLQQMKRK